MHVAVGYCAGHVLADHDGLAIGADVMTVGIDTQAWVDRLEACSNEIKVTWMAKHSLFWPPLGWLMRALGGMPIVRHRTGNTVDAMVEAFRDRAQLILVVPTEGTRARVEYWKSGFYHIARRAGVPIVPSFLDFAQKRGGFGPAMTPCGDVKKDMDYFRDFYRDTQGRFPALFGPIRLREESESS